MNWAEEHDVIVIGSGSAGLSSALFAHEAGFDTVLLEKGEQLGGGTSYSYGLIWVGCNQLAKEAGLQDDLESVLAYMRHIGGGHQVDDRVVTLATTSSSAVAQLMKCGVRLQIVRGLKDIYCDVAPGANAEGRSLEHVPISGYELGQWRERILLPPHHPYQASVSEFLAWGGINNDTNWEQEVLEDRRRRDIRAMGVGLVSGLVKALIERHIDIRPATPAYRLLQEADEVVGVELTDGSKLRAKRGVILAAGSYESNTELVKRFDWLPGFASMFPATRDGDGLIMGSEIGAKVRIIQPSLRVHLGLVFPADENRPSGFRSASIVELCSPHTMVVNKAGKRFANEAFFQDVAPHVKKFDVASQSHPNLPCFLIFDSQYTRRFSFAGLRAGSAIPDWVARADTLPELAAKLGIDSSGLSGTVSRFNRFADKGIDDDFGRGSELWRLDQKDREVQNSRLGKIKDGPFYGVELHPSYSGVAGLEADSKARALHERGRAIPGLYVTGNTAAATEYGPAYQAGVSLASALTYSYIAVNDIVARGH